MTGFRLHRAEDWTPELREAATAYEQAVNSSKPIPKDVKRRYGAAVLEQDRLRRPEFYASAPAAVEKVQTMLTWKTISPTDEELFSGSELIGTVRQHSDGEQSWVVFTGLAGDGFSESREEAKTAAEQAFKEWCARAGLGPAITEGWQLVPVDPKSVKAWTALHPNGHLFSWLTGPTKEHVYEQLDRVCLGEPYADRWRIVPVMIVPAETQEVRMNTEGGSDAISR